MIGGFISLFLSIAFLAGSEHPPLSSPFARLQYPGSFGHYTGLLRIAERNGLEVVGPSKETSGQMSIRGLWQGRPFQVSSVDEYIEVRIECLRELRRINLIPGNPKLELPENEQIRDWKIQLTKSKPARLLVWPVAGIEIQDEDIAALTDQFVDGKNLLNVGTQFRSEGTRIYFVRPHGVRKSWSEAQVSQSIEWLYSTARKLETSVFSSSVSPSDRSQHPKSS